MRRTALLLLAVLAAGSIAAQETFFSESIEIRVINVDVIVTDKNGAPVTGLTMADFELFGNGAKRDITNFYEYRGLPSGSGVAPTPQATAAAPVTADLRPRRIVLFIDDDSLQPANRYRVFPELKHFVRSAPAESLEQRKEITLKLDVTVDDATNGLSVGVIDDVSRSTGFATIKVPIR